MPTALDSLLQLQQPIDPHNPSGDDLAYTASYAEMERLAQGRPEQQYGSTVVDAAEPDWDGLRDRALELATFSHDLRVGVYLTEAWSHTEGFSGLVCGLELLAVWVENEWDTLYPPLDPEDGDEAVERSNILLGLCDADRMLPTLLNTPLAECPRIGGCSLLDLKVARGERQPAGDHLTEPEIEAVFSAAGIELFAIQKMLERGLVALGRIRQVFEDQTGTFPNLEPIEGMLKEILGVLEDMTPAEPQTRLERPAPEAGPAHCEEANERSGRPVTIDNRREVTAALDALCDYYRRNEPSSPVPLLLRRARRLVDLDFLEIMRDLAPDGLAEVSRWAGGADARD